MRKMYVSDIKDRCQVDSMFLVKDKIMAMAKNGKPYLTLRLMDKTGEVEARVWDNVDQLASIFEKDDFVAVRSKATVYLGKMQLVVSELTRVPDEQVSLADFLPETDRNIQEMEAELRTLVQSIADRNIRLLLQAFFDDPAVMATYRMAPAAKGMHHVYLGGLLEHSLAVSRLVDGIVPLYEGINRDLLIAGALLHDVGKVREMSFTRSFDYTDEGKLLGHITIGVEMIQEKVAGLPGFPPELAMLLKHMLLSHHGQYEFGSPKRPKTLEATILNYLDDLDSKINGIRTHIRKEPDNQSRWTSYHRLYDRYFYKDSFPCEEGEEPAPLDVPAATAPPTASVAEDPAPFAAAPAEPAAAPAASAADQRKGFTNSPFAKLKEENLNLF